MLNTLEQIDQQKLEDFAGQVISDMSATMASAMTYIGHRLGLYKAMNGAGPITAKELAGKAGAFERYVREWLNCQAAGGYVTYLPETQTYELPPEHAMVLAIEDSPVFLAPGFALSATVWSEEELLVEEFKNGKGLNWNNHSHKLFYGVEAFYRPGYKTNLVESWIASLNGMTEKLRRGGKVADVGCGHGASTVIMAKAFPNSQFYGFDNHKESIEIARERAREAGVKNVTFLTASADDFPGEDYDMICFMDAFHDLGSPTRAAIHSKKALSKDGSLMLVEPFAGDKPEDNLNPIGRMYYAGSTAFCVPHSQSEGGECLGAQAGKAKLGEILRKAGFSSFDVAASTPVNLILEAKH